MARASAPRSTRVCHMHQPASCLAWQVPPTSPSGIRSMALYIRRMQHDDMPPVVLAFPQDISVTPRGAYYAPYMGAPNNNDLLSSEAAIRTLTWTLNKASGEGVNRRVVLDQFRWGEGAGQGCDAVRCTAVHTTCWCLHLHVCMCSSASQRPPSTSAPVRMGRSHALPRCIHHARQIHTACQAPATHTHLPPQPTTAGSLTAAPRASTTARWTQHSCLPSWARPHRCSRTCLWAMACGPTGPTAAMSCTTVPSNSALTAGLWRAAAAGLSTQTLRTWHCTCMPPTGLRA
jgi:hypothetical protein